MKLTPQSEVALIRRLACLESAWRPLRTEYAIAPAVAAARAEGGYSLWQHGGGAIEWKRDQRMRDNLITAGHLDIDGNLTPSGKRAARQLVWPYEVSELLTALRRIATHTAAGDTLAGLVPETLIVGVAWDGKAATPFAALQMLLVPCMADGLVRAASTIHGHAYYGLATPLAPEAIAAEAIGIPTEHRPDLHTVYCEAYREAWASIRTDQTRYIEIGEPPLPSAGLDSGHDQHDIAGIAPLFVEAAVDA